MASRHEPHDSLEDFPTPPWATRAVFEHVLKPLLGEADPLVMGRLACWEPCCNRGYMARPLNDYFARVYSTDVEDYGWEGQELVWDFLFPNVSETIGEYDAIIFNPPFKLASQFVQRALGLGPTVVGAFVRTNFAEGESRYRELFSVTPPTVIAHFAERVILSKGCVRDPEKLYWNEEKKRWQKPSTATAYCWMLWIDAWEPKPPMWIPPCRKSLEQPGDYDEYGVTKTVPMIQNGDNRESPDD